MVLALERVTRVYDERRALDEVSFTVRPGRMTGFVGANGAGKTTAMRIVMGVLAATSGRGDCSDGRPLTRGVRRTFGYMPEERGLYPRMRVLDQLVHLGRVHGMSPGVRDATRDRAARRARPGRAQRTTCSRRSRSATSSACRSPPRSCTTPCCSCSTSRSPAWTRWRSTRWASCCARAPRAGVPVLFSSHQLELVEQLCDDVVIIDGGRVVTAGSADEVRSRRVVGGATGCGCRATRPVAELVAAAGRGHRGPCVRRHGRRRARRRPWTTRRCWAAAQAHGVLREFAVGAPDARRDLPGGGPVNDRMSAWRAIRVIAGARGRRSSCGTRRSSARRCSCSCWSPLATLIPVLIQQRVPSIRVAVQGSAAVDGGGPGDRAGPRRAGLGDRPAPGARGVRRGRAAGRGPDLRRGGAGPRRRAAGARDGDVAAAVVGEDLTALTVLGARGSARTSSTCCCARRPASCRCQQAAADAGPVRRAGRGADQSR